MQISLDWLKELIDFDLDVETLTHKLTMIGLECEATPLIGSLEKIVVCKVIASETHPNAANLKVCQVDCGGEEAVTIVCGAPNVRKGMKAPLALPGAVLGGEYKIKSIDKYGVTSDGMLCSEAELGLSDDQTGIMRLERSLKIGAPIAEALKLDDYIIHFDLTPNRPDCLSAIGIARDIGAMTGSRLKRPSVKIRELETPAADAVRVDIEDDDACPRYAARVIRNVAVGPSPWWIKQRLLASGIRSINNVVDITNYVMLEYGQPLHAFDYDNFRQPQVLVRRARIGEKFTTLDGVERELNKDVLLITDGDRPVAIGGIMGGEYSEVTEKTTTVLLESAHFDSRVIRRGRKHLDITSESQDRFERGADPNIVLTALDRAASLIDKYAQGEILAGTVDCYPNKIEPLQLELRPPRVNQILATDLSTPEMIDILDSLEFGVTPGKNLQVIVPTFRPDVTQEIDLVEEVARIHGYEKIPCHTETGGGLVTSRVESEEFHTHLRRVLTAQGYYEVVTNTIVNPKEVLLLDEGVEYIKIRNPISEDLQWLRRELFSSLLNVVRHNLNHQVEKVKVFEIGNTFIPIGEKLPSEEWRLCLALAGGDTGENWTFHPGAFTLYDLKGALECIAILVDREVSLSLAESKVFDPGCSFEVMLGGVGIGTCGSVSRVILESFGIKSEVFLGELRIKSLINTRRGPAEYQPLPRFPSAERDLAIVVGEKVIIADLVATITAAADQTLRETVLFDLYRGKQVGQGRKSVAFRLVFRDESKTLTDEHIDNLCNRIVDKLRVEHDAQLRA